MGLLAKWLNTHSFETGSRPVPLLLMDLMANWLKAHSFGTRYQPVPHGVMATELGIARLVAIRKYGKRHVRNMTIFKSMECLAIHVPPGVIYHIRAVNLGVTVAL